MRAEKTKTEVRQEQIARAALTLISRHGLRKLSVASVAQAVGVVPSAIYRHFESKDEVLNGVVDLISQRLKENVQAVRAETPDPLERLHRLLIRHVRLVRTEVPLPRVLFSEDIFHGHRQRRRRVYQLFSAYLDAIAELIAEGQRAGSIRNDQAPNTLSVMFLGLVQPAAILWLMSDGAFNVERHAEEGWKIFSAMLRPIQSLGHSTTLSPDYAHESIQVKRVHDAPTAGDGQRFLVDRLWPRGVQKKALHLDGWLKEAAPSAELRRWFQHDSAKWAEFRRRYFAQLAEQPAALKPILAAAARGRVTLLFGAKDPEHNHAVALRDYMLTLKGTKTS